MSASMRRRSIPLVLLITILALALPAQPIAAVNVSQIVTQTTGDFAAGKFGLTGLAQNGGVQLVPLGQLRQWQTTAGNMCGIGVGDMGTASFGPYIYSIGGSTSALIGGNLQQQRLRSVCRTKVLDTNATLEEWVTLPAENLPEKRTAMAAVAVPRPTDASRGYLYTFGGLKETTTSQRNTIWMAGINNDGSLTPWMTQTLTLPTAREQLTATAFTNAAGKTFIYVIGGYQRPFASTFAYRDVLRYEVSADGTLIDRSDPAAVPPLPTPNFAGNPAQCAAVTGLKQADALTVDAATLDLLGSRRFLAVLGGVLQVGTGDGTGGCTDQAVTSERVFLADVNEETGDIVWQNEDYTLPEPVSQLRAVGVNGKLYATGGILGVNQASATNLTYSSYINIETMTLPSYGFGPDSSNFLASAGALRPDQKRAEHGMEIVTLNNRPIVFLFGGTNGDGTYRSDVLYGFIGRAEDFDETTGGYGSPGVYQSPIYTLRGSGALSELKWTAAVTTTGPITTDIKMQYRLAETTTQIKTATWITVDANPSPTFFSVAGVNVAASVDPALGRYFQYRALLTTSAPQDRTATPALRGPVSLRYKVDGHPSLYIDAASNFPPIQSGVMIDPNIIIANNLKPGSTSTERILDADIEDAGTFFVDLYVYPPSASSIITPTRDPATGVYPLTSAAFAQVSKTLVRADSTFRVPIDAWRKTCGLTANCPVPNWQVIFNQPGDWTVLAIVDSQNNVAEADELTGEWENDNVYRFTVVSEVSGGTLFMPIIFKQPAVAP